MLVYFSQVEFTFSFLPFVVFIHCRHLILLQFPLSSVKMNKLVWRQMELHTGKIFLKLNVQCLFFFFSPNKSKTEEITIKLCIYITPKETIPATKSFETPWILVECKSWRTFLQVIFDCFSSHAAAQKEFSRDDMQGKKSLKVLIHWSLWEWHRSLFWGEQSWCSTWNVAWWLKTFKMSKIWGDSKRKKAQRMKLLMWSDPIT